MPLPEILAGIGLASTVIGGVAGRNQNKANAQIARIRTLAKRDAMERKIDKLMRFQRESIGTARAVMAKRGGYGQDQTIMLEGMVMNRMARDMSELEYQKTVAGIEGEYEASYWESAATASMISAGSKAAGQIFNGYMAYRDYAPAGGGSDYQHPESIVRMDQSQMKLDYAATA